ncbi:hypothetical protein SLEP1_g30844 [Rubroshorea leprosula]|uniref:non-specific serine/threonine protein kinase n=1 Tax=Rubroshorea leprosula TaxID=152421 RepID=A0AAV5K6V0_9ROSI|nr:hypothetical protein SLEP1_g30844 [Rubroshorea leprosula]
MLQNSAEFRNLGMSKSKVWTLGAVFVGCFFLSSLLVGAQNNSILQPDEVSALRTIKRSLIDPNKNLSNWNRGDPCTSNWTGVCCFNTTREDGYLHVRELESFWMLQNFPLVCDRRCFRTLLNSAILGCLNPKSGPWELSLSATSFCLHCLLEHKITSLSLMKVAFLIESLRNCNVQGSIPDISRIPSLYYLDLSSNHLSGPILTSKISKNITTIDLSNNELNGTIPASFSGLPLLQNLILANNSLNGSIPSSIWQNRTQNVSESLKVDLEYNSLDSISGSSDLPQNVTLWLKGNPICSNPTNGNIVLFCRTKSENESMISTATNSITNCPPESCPPSYEYSPTFPIPCFCAVPLPVGYRLKSPGFSDFRPYIEAFEVYLTNGLSLKLFQLYINSFAWEGPRLRMYLKLYPVYNASSSNSNLFNESEVRRIRSMFTGWRINGSNIFGPYELINFTLSDIYKDEFRIPSSDMSPGALAGITLVTIGGAAAVTLSAIVSVIFLRRHLRNYRAVAKRRQGEYLKIPKIMSKTEIEKECWPCSNGSNGSNKTESFGGVLGPTSFNLRMHYKDVLAAVFHMTMQFGDCETTLNTAENSYWLVCYIAAYKYLGSPGVLQPAKDTA